MSTIFLNINEVLYYKRIGNEVHYRFEHVNNVMFKQWLESILNEKI